MENENRISFKPTLGDTINGLHTLTHVTYAHILTVCLRVKNIAPVVTYTTRQLEIKVHSLGTLPCLPFTSALRPLGVLHSLGGTTSESVLYQLNCLMRTEADCDRLQCWLLKREIFSPLYSS